MRTYDVVVTIGLVSLALGLSPAASFDGTRTPAGPVVTSIPLQDPPDRNLGGGTALATVPVRPLTPHPRPTPIEALRSGTLALRAGRPGEAVTALEYAAGQGVPGAMWKLGRMYADGDGVDQNKLRAFKYFRDLTKAHAYDPPGTPQARFVANAFVTLGHFYLDGIPNSAIKADPAIAREMFRYAASYFGDPDAQYLLGRLYLDGKGVARDPLQAARWFGLAANKDQRSAQAMLGSMLFSGNDLPRQAALGLFWLTLAKDGVAKGSPDSAWITDTYSKAFARANDEERALAYRYLENWLRKPHH
jgi:TPR repeat protein